MPVGITNITLLVSDPCHNTNTCISVLTVFTTNAPPVALNKGGATSTTIPFTISKTKLLLGATDPEGDPLTVVSVSATSTNGGAVVLGSTLATYTPLPGFTGVDRFTYTIGDGHGNLASAIVEVLVASGNLPSLNQMAVDTVPGGVRVRFAGIPGFNYQIQRATAVNGPWTTLTTQAAPLHGIIEYLDTNPPGGSAFYRTAKP